MTTFQSFFKAPSGVESDRDTSLVILLICGHQDMFDYVAHTLARVPDWTYQAANIGRIDVCLPFQRLEGRQYDAVKLVHPMPDQPKLFWLWIRSTVLLNTKSAVALVSENAADRDTSHNMTVATLQKLFELFPSPADETVTLKALEP